jgi:hypothetical protein
MSFCFLFDEILDDAPRCAEGTLLTLTMRGVSVDASVPVEKIIKFKRARQDQYIELKAQIDELARHLDTEEHISPEEMMDKAKSLYEKRLKEA